MGGGASAANYTFPDSGDTTKPVGRYDQWLSEAEYIPGLIDAMLDPGTLTPWGDYVAVQADDYMGKLVAGQTQHEANRHRGAITDISPSTLVEGYFDTARAKVDEAAAFPTIDTRSEISEIAVTDGSILDVAMDAARVSAASDSALATSQASENMSIGVGKAQMVLDAALAAANRAIKGTPMDAVVQQYETKVRNSYLKRISDLAVGLSGIGAINSSAYVFGMASILSQLQQDVDTFTAQLVLQTHQNAMQTYIQGIGVYAEFLKNANVYTQLYMDAFKSVFSQHMVIHAEMNSKRKAARDAALIEGLRGMMSTFEMKMRLDQGYVAAQAEISRVRFESLTSEKNVQAEADAKDAYYGFQAFEYAGNMLASASGAAVVPKGPSPLQQIVSGAFSVAAAFAGRPPV